jgi:hypothetical protein
MDSLSRFCQSCLQRSPADQLQKTATFDLELFDQMTELYPHWVANQSMVDVRISAAIIHIKRDGPRLRALRKQWVEHMKKCFC